MENSSALMTKVMELASAELCLVQTTKHRYDSTDIGSTTYQKNSKFVHINCNYYNHLMNRVHSIFM